jgi:hypothetical protein
LDRSLTQSRYRNQSKKRNKKQRSPSIRHPAECNPQTPAHNKKFPPVTLTAFYSSLKVLRSIRPAHLRAPRTIITRMFERDKYFSMMRQQL